MSFLALSIAAAVVPTVIYAWIVWRLDRYEKEPWGLLAAAFLWGALPAAALAIVVEAIADVPLAALPQTANRLIGASIVAPLAEEGLKALALLGLARRARYEFDGVLDGIVYGSLIGLGFGMTENLLYFLGNQGDLASWGYVVLGRAVAFGFNHAMYTSMTGIGLGIAVHSASRGRARGYALLGLSAAVVAHHLHNFYLATDRLCLISLLFDWSGVVLVGIIVWLSWRREHERIVTELADEVRAGVLTEAQLKAIGSRVRSLQRIASELGHHGRQQARLWRSLSHAAVELAFRKHRAAATGRVDARNEDTMRDLRARILRIRLRLGDALVADRVPCPACGRPTGASQGTCEFCGSDAAFQ